MRKPYVTTTRTGRHKAVVELEDGFTTRTFGTRREANEWIAETTVDVRRGRFVDDRRAVNLAFAKWANEWWETQAHLRPSTKAGYLTCLRNHVVPAFRNKSVGGITQPAVKKWVALLQSKGLAPASVLRAYQIFRRIMEAAVDAELIGRTPCRNINNLPKVKATALRILEPGEIVRLADVIDPRYRALVLDMAFAGLRIGEVAGLRRKCVDATKGRLHVVETAVEVRGHVYFGPPKTDAGVRTVTLPPTIAAELRAHLDRFTAGGDDALVFAGPDGGVLRPAGWRRRFWKPALEAAGLPTSLRPHDLRHTAVSLWIEAGVNIREITRRAGHQSVAFTLQRYGHLLPNADEDGALQIEERFLSGSEKNGRKWDLDAA
jgi:integrase